MRRPSALPLLALACLASCAGQGGDFPSLAPRPIEQMSDTPPDRPVAVATPDAALDARLADVAKELASADQAFAPAARKAGGLVAAAHNAGVGSEAWLDAQTALADLDGIRAESTAALSTLDELAIGRARALEPAYPVLESLHHQAESQVASESAAIAGLQKQLPAT